VSGARLALLLVALGLAPRAASAVYQCGDQKDDCQCGMSDPYPCCDNGGNCTWWAWEAACCNWAVGLPGWGNANQWRGNALAHPDYDVIDHPVVGSIANRTSGTYGHVAWVVGIDGLKLTVTEENCCTGCNYGMRTYTYSDWHYFDGGFIVRNGQCACTPGQAQSQGCGRCGQQERACGDDCQWGGWGACGGEGPCGEGQIETAACGDCGEHTRTCTASCQWGEWGACGGPDPAGDGGGVACDTGLSGACAAGVQRCVDGTLTCAQTAQASTEVCDRVDNDCNGATDEGDVCPDAGPPPGDGGAPGGDGGAPGGDGGTPGGDGVVGSCGCRVGGQGAAPLAWLLVLLPVRWRRRG
jgi:MYXO-CTERM domain-containing protein